MRINRWLVAAGMAAVLGLGMSQGQAQPQDRGDRPDLRNMDPAQRQQFFMDRIKERLEVTDDTEWKALPPPVQKVIDARMATASGMGGPGMMMGRPRGGDRGGDRGGRAFGPQPSAESEALQRAIEGKASNSELKAAIAKVQEARKAKQAELEKAQAELRKVLSVRQEAIATASGWL
jgi:hypothetical protein